MSEKKLAESTAEPRIAKGQAWWSLSPDEALVALTSAGGGLSAAEAARRLEQFGPNALQAPQGFPWLPRLLGQFTSPLIYILLAAAVVTVFLEEYVDAGFILAVVLFNAVIGFFQEYRAEKSMEALLSLAVARAHVLRDGRERELDSELLVPGDVVVIDAGARIPADCRLLHAAALEVDESLLTGESATVGKTVGSVPRETALADRSCTLSMGTVCVRGRARAVVFATGLETQLGEIAGRVEEIGSSEVPLLSRMARFAQLLSFVVLAGSIAGFAGGLAAGEPAEDLFFTLVALAVSAIPEGLPIVLTVTLAIGVNRMAKRNVIIRRLAAVETLGSCTVIGSDKTGTLTQNRMTVTQLYAGGRAYAVSGSGYEVEGELHMDGEPVTLAEDSPAALSLLAGSLANEATLVLDEDGRPVVTGDPTEIALLVSAAKAGLWKDEVEERFERWAEIPFDPERRFAATFHSRGDHNYVFAKGAPERILRMCSVAAGGGALDPAQVLEAAEEMASNGLRVLAMAYEESTEPGSVEDFRHNTSLTFLGLQGMIDPPRAEAREAVDGCRDAGIRVLMITGDHASTALAIARQLGIASEADEAVRGEALDSMDDATLAKVVRNVPVFARVSPDHKLRIVRALQAQEEVVAVTGDGVNDGPALKAANVGVAMGRSGTDVAKEAADVVATDDNFASIFAGVEEGRVVFDNVRLVTFFLISCGVGEVLAVLASIFFRFEVLLLPTQLLWLNLVTNGIEGVALAFEPGEKDVLKRRPRPLREGIINRRLWERTALTGLVLAAGTVLLFLIELDGDETLERARTIALSTLVVFQVFQVGNCRSETRSLFVKSPLGNPFLLLGTMAALLIHVGAVYFGPTQSLLELDALSLEDWGLIAAVSSSVLIVNEVHKLLSRPTEAKEK